MGVKTHRCNSKVAVDRLKAQVSTSGSCEVHTQNLATMQCCWCASVDQALKSKQHAHTVCGTISICLCSLILHLELVPCLICKSSPCCRVSHPDAPVPPPTTMPAACKTRKPITKLYRVECLCERLLRRTQARLTDSRAKHRAGWQSNHATVPCSLLLPLLLSLASR